ncbi:MAG: right-handed parallel beta-helix repeat-containing protein [Planctomycetes bacterium]|nr:right-handed parallel beta-helix repeat-containing protein [Planctomycetota bacterium]
MRIKTIIIHVGLCAAVGVVSSVNRDSEADVLSDREYHVSVHGNDTNDGSVSRPLRTISAAAQMAQPGDVVTVHEGVYRERINPLRGGESDQKRVAYQAVPGETVVIKGSEIIKGWRKVQNDTWKVAIPNTFFGDFNPYSDVIHGDWFNPKGRDHHTGAVYLSGHWLTEAAKLDDVLRPIGNTPLWFGQVDEMTTTIWAQFKGVDPNEVEVEINVRQTVFYPDKPGINYITVHGFTMMHAATPWAPPTAEQIGLIGTHWSKGWIIENNDIRYSTCVGITLGKYGDQWDNTSQNTAEGYVKTIERALENGWSRENIGHHIVRNNHIAHCEQAGIVGSLGAAFSNITGNVIHDIHIRQLFTGAEMAGIKIHAAIDAEISRNHIYRTCRGIWLDWMAQGTRVTGNLLHDNTTREDLFMEVNHGPFLIDNNCFLSDRSLRDWSEGGAYVHNLFAGRIELRPELRRSTPFHQAHSTEVAGLRNIPGGDNRFYNNLLIQPAGLAAYDKAAQPVQIAGNMFLKGAKPCKHEQVPLVLPNFDPGIELVEEPHGLCLQIALDKAWAAGQSRKLVTTKLLGRAKIPDLPYEQPDGTPYRIDIDYFGTKRNPDNPFPGPFELAAGGKHVLKVWPVTTPAGDACSAQAR